MTRRALPTLLSLVGLVAGASAQPLGFDDFSWTFVGRADTTGSLTSTTMVVQGAADDSFCNDELAYYETTAPWDGTVRVHLDWEIFDVCHFDWPIYVIDGAFTKAPLPGAGTGSDRKPDNRVLIAAACMAANMKEERLLANFGEETVNRADPLRGLRLHRVGAVERERVGGDLGPWRG